MDDGAKFKNTFDRILFAVIGTHTFQTFKDVMGDRVEGSSGVR